MPDLTALTDAVAALEAEVKTAETALGAAAPSQQADVDALTARITDLTSSLTADVPAPLAAPEGLATDAAPSDVPAWKPPGS